MGGGGGGGEEDEKGYSGMSELNHAIYAKLRAESAVIQKEPPPVPPPPSAQPLSSPPRDKTSTKKNKI
ncbi:hypothetical protein M0804_002565 [Polistes exclamans]|nr:hypothetical protein M0804_002565 [Polistes exclamans]